jgi:RsiW-degrading membrane proteinase PrsW (M82 family)
LWLTPLGWALVLVVFLLGMLTGRAAGFIEDALLNWQEPWRDSIPMQAAMASLTEELLKLLVVLSVAWFFSREFNDPMDGLVYGAYAGLGAAVEESWFYLHLIPDPDISLVGTEAIRLLLHVFLGALAGFGVGLARFRLPRWKAIFFGALLADFSIHFGWDYLCGIPAQMGEPLLWQRIGAIVLMFAALSLFGLAVMWASRWSREMHAPESSDRHWGWPFSLLFGEREQ